MSNSDALDRFRILLSDQLWAAVIVLVLLAALGGWLTYTTHVDPGEEIEQEDFDWETTADFDHSANVTQDTEPFSEGERVENLPVYFDRLMPQLDGQFQYAHTGDGTLDVDVELTYVVREVYEVDDDQTVPVWQDETHLGNNTATLGSEDAASMNFDIDVNATFQQFDRVQEQLGSSPGTTEAFVRAEVTGDGEMYDQPVDVSETHELPIEMQNPTYVVSDIGSDSSYTVSETQVVEAEYGPFRVVGSILLLAVPVLGLVGLAGTRYSRKLDPGQERREQLSHQKGRENFDDWITKGTLTPSLLNSHRVYVDSLEGLVDVAIDSDKRVIEDRDRNGYFVVDDGVIYLYEPDRDWKDETVRGYATPLSGNGQSEGGEQSRDKSLETDDTQ